MGWNPRTYELRVDGQDVPGSNILDLAAHTVRERRGKARIRGRSPGAPPGFAQFARGLLDINAPRELVRNRRRWGTVYGDRARRTRSPSVGSSTSNVSRGSSASRTPQKRKLRRKKQKTVYSTPSSVPSSTRKTRASRAQSFRDWQQLGK